MQYLKARQRKDGRWDYTAQHDGTVRPIGYCHAFIDPDDYGDLVRISPERAEIIRQFGHKHHTDGHATVEEACACYKDYLLDQRVSHTDMLDMLLKCDRCDEWTHHSVSIDGRKRHILCKDCATREALEGLVNVGERWEA